MRLDGPRSGRGRRPPNPLVRESVPLHQNPFLYINEQQWSPTRSYRVVTTGGLLQGTHWYTSFARGRDITRETALLPIVGSQYVMRVKRGDGELEFSLIPVPPPPSGKGWL